jgi:hypothetical protein
MIWPIVGNVPLGDMPYILLFILPKEITLINKNELGISQRTKGIDVIRRIGFYATTV